MNCRKQRLRYRRWSCDESKEWRRVDWKTLRSHGRWKSSHKHRDSTILIQYDRTTLCIPETNMAAHYQPYMTNFSYLQICVCKERSGYWYLECEDVFLLSQAQRQNIPFCVTSKRMAYSGRDHVSFGVTKNEKGWNNGILCEDREKSNIILFASIKL